jgi:hypothetical protein
LYQENLIYRNNQTGNLITEIPGMALIEIVKFNEDSYEIIINGQGVAVLCATSLPAVKAWIEGYLAGRYQEFKIVLGRR